MRFIAIAAAGYADAGYFTIVDDIFSPRWFFAPLRDALQGAGHAFAYAILRPPVEVRAARAASRPDHQLADLSVIEQLWQDFADIGSLEDHATAGHQATPEATAAELAQRLGDRLLDV